MSTTQDVSSAKISLFNSSISQWRQRSLPFVLRATLAGLLGTTPAVQALVITDIGTSGTPGISGVSGTNGGGGGTGAVVATSSDLNNAVSATGGTGGVGGNSLPLLPGGNGGRGGLGTASLDVTGQQLDVLPPSTLATVSATGGRGGDGGAGLVRGSGGAGGDAQASGSNNNPFLVEVGEFSSLLEVDATGGAGGNGRSGGAGGNAQATATEMSSGYLVPGKSTATATAQGGKGGNATLLSAGAGGDATASAVLDIDVKAQYTVSNASAIGGNGGNSATGLHGDGGDATALADGRRPGGQAVDGLYASAIGGDSGSGGGLRPFSGTGGAAIAISRTDIEGWSSLPEGPAVAQGGRGAVRGGDAIAISEIASGFSGGYAVATATAGAGPSAGAAMALAYGSGSRNGGGGDAVANAPSGFARQVTVHTSSATQYWGQYTTRAMSVATIGDVGDVDNLPVKMPTAAEVAAQLGYAVSALAPTEEQAAATLAGHGAVAAQAATGSVWGVMDIATTEGVRRFEPIPHYVSYTFATDAIDDSGRLWLGLLNPDLPATFADFSLRITGEGNLLFEQEFDVDLFETAFTDTLIDLGEWAGIRGNDGLFNLDIVFAGFVPELTFAFGSDRPIAGVPEPSVLSLLLVVLLGLVTRSRHASTM